MGREVAEAFPSARHALEEVNDALGQNLSRLMFEGPESELTLTENAQPAIMAVSLAVFRVLTEDGKIQLARAARFVAGHSLGEYSALAVAATFTLGDTARLLKIRGQAMQKAVPVGQGAMAALLGVDVEIARSIAKEAAGEGVCEAANDNAPGQVVLSGARAAIERAVQIAPTKGAKRAIMLPVSAPFHCALMAPAATAMENALAAVDMKEPWIPVVANVTAKAVEAPEDIRSHLVAQVTGMVRWRESVLYLREQGVATLVEIGAGRVLTGLTKRINPDLSGISVGTPQEIDAFLKTL